MIEYVVTNLKLDRLELNYVPKNDLPMCDIEIGEDFKTLDDFAYRECHIFAAALNKLFGYRMRVIWNEYRKGGKGVVHAYAMVNYYGREFLLDAFGQTNEDGVKIYIQDEINEEEIEPLFTSDCYEDYEDFLNEFVNEFGINEKEEYAMRQTIKGVEDYLHQNMRVYVPQYTLTVELAQKYEWEFTTEKVYDSNECQFEFKNDERETLFIRLCKNQGYDVELYSDEELIYQCSPNDIKELEIELDRIITGEYYFNKN